MKRFLNVLIIIFFALSVKAQETYIQGGLNLANITKNNAGETEKNNMLTSFNAGLMHRFVVAPVFAVETGLLFTGRGSKAETYFTNGDYVKSRFNPYYLELPLNFIAQVPFANSTNMFAYAGPYASMGIAGKSKTETKLLDFYSTSEKNIKFSNDDPFTSQQDDAAYDKIKRFDFGLNFGAGFAFEHLILKVNYGLGLTRINSTESDNNANDRNKYRTVSFSVGIPIGK